jgi:hypothetical protein
VKVLDDAIAFLLVQMDDCFGIALRSIAMTLRFQPGTKRRVVINLAVVGDPHAPVLVAHRLLAGSADIDDRQAPVRQSDGAIDEQTFSVRASMAHDIAHPRQTVNIDTLARIEIDDAGKSTHGRKGSRF